MPCKIVYTDSCNKRAGRFLKKHPEVLKQYEKTLNLFDLNPHHPSLRLHRLKGRLSDLHSVSVNISYRITITFLITEKAIVPIATGSYDEVY